MPWINCWHTHRKIVGSLNIAHNIIRLQPNTKQVHNYITLSHLVPQPPLAVLSQACLDSLCRGRISLSSTSFSSGQTLADLAAAEEHLAASSLLLSRIFVLLDVGRLAVSVMELVATLLTDNQELFSVLHPEMLTRSRKLDLWLPPHTEQWRSFSLLSKCFLA